MKAWKRCEDVPAVFLNGKKFEGKPTRWIEEIDRGLVEAKEDEIRVRKEHRERQRYKVQGTERHKVQG